MAATPDTLPDRSKPILPCCNSRIGSAASPTDTPRRFCGAFEALPSLEARCSIKLSTPPKLDRALGNVQDGDVSKFVREQVVNKRRFTASHIKKMCSTTRFRTESEAEWLRKNRTEDAARWNLPTDMRLEHLQYADSECERPGCICSRALQQWPGGFCHSVKSTLFHLPECDTLNPVTCHARECTIPIDPAASSISCTIAPWFSVCNNAKAVDFNSSAFGVSDADPANRTIQ